MVGKKMKKEMLEVSELPKYRDLEITKVKKSKKKVVKLEKPDSFAFNDIQSDLEELMREEVDEDMEEQINVKKELEKQSNLEEVPTAAPRPPTPVALEGSASTGTATGWAETPSLPQGWKYRLFGILFFICWNLNLLCRFFICRFSYRESVRGGQTVSYFLSPKAKIFPCRRLALKYLMEVILC